MNVIVEKRPIEGTLKTLVGTYSLLDTVPKVVRNAHQFKIVDDEGFYNVAIVVGDFIVIPTSVFTTMDVKRILTVEEEPLYRDELTDGKKLDELGALDLETATSE